MNGIKEDLKRHLHLQSTSDEELTSALMGYPDPDEPGRGITSLSNRQLARLLLRRDPEPTAIREGK